MTLILASNPWVAMAQERSVGEVYAGERADERDKTPSNTFPLDLQCRVPDHFRKLRWLPYSSIQSKTRSELMACQWLLLGEKQAS